MFQSAPHFSSEANQLDWVVKAVDADVSIRASLQQRGERERLSRSQWPDTSFNPRLTSAARRTSAFPFF